MTTIPFRQIAVLLPMAMICTGAFSQKGINSIYSAYGIGDYRMRIAWPRNDETPAGPGFRGTPAALEPQSARTQVAVRQMKATQPFTSSFLPPSISLIDLALKLRSSDGL